MKVTATQTSAREALQQRQGKGARYDAPEAPAADLLKMRHATAYFARIMGQLDDARMLVPSDCDPGLTPARILAEVGYEARRFALALEPLCASGSGPHAEAHLDDLPDISLATTLPPRALRHLFHHSAIHLDVCLRDLPGQAWGERVDLGCDQSVPVSDLPGRRTRKLMRAVDELSNGAFRV
ncbi:MAG: maleylpyruvate isomerase N-terminal domain-containing protein [Pseudomonadota bacterium]